MPWARGHSGTGESTQDGREKANTQTQGKHIAEHQKTKLQCKKLLGTTADGEVCLVCDHPIRMQEDPGPYAECLTLYYYCYCYSIATAAAKHRCEAEKQSKREMSGELRSQ